MGGVSQPSIVGNRRQLLPGKTSLRSRPSACSICWGRSHLEQHGDTLVTVCQLGHVLAELTQAADGTAGRV